MEEIEGDFSFFMYTQKASISEAFLFKTILFINSPACKRLLYF